MMPLISAVKVMKSVDIVLRESKEIVLRWRSSVTTDAIADAILMLLLSHDHSVALAKHT